MSNSFQKIPEQEDVVFEQKSQIVSASAGSGKTTVMIRKVVEHIKAHDCHVDEVLILTYTTAAALEMKKKLVERLKKESLENEFLLDELDMVQTADICTIDSFCQKLIKKYFYILNIDPSFKILDSGDEIILQGKALDLALEKLKQQNACDYENLISNLAPSRNEQNIKKLVLEIYNYLTSVFEQNKFWEQTFLLYDKKLKLAEKELMSYYLQKFLEIKNELDKLQSLAKKFGFDKYVIHINEINSELDKLMHEQDFCDLVENSNKVSLNILRTLKDDEINFKVKISEQKDKFKKIRDELKNEYIDGQNIIKSYDNCILLIEALKKLYDFFDFYYTQEKLKQNTYDFNDVERLAIKLLDNNQANEEIKNSYKKIFVDEFQDANRVQEKIIFLLDNKNLFFVGDTKQSIYGFRQSEPEIFLDIEKKFEKLDYACAKKLNCNFRTNKNILQFANYVFSQIMTTNSCGLNYKEKAQFEPKAFFEDLPGETCVSFDIILPKDEQEQKLPITQIYSVKKNAVNTNNYNAYDYESAYICQKITELLGQDIFDKETEKIRKINFNDIAILINKRGSFLPTLLKHLKSVGIPYIVNVNDNLEECYDNQVLFSILKLSQNFQDDYSLYAVMESNLFNFSEQELAEIKFENIDERYFYTCVKLYAQKQNDLAQKIQEFFNVIDDFCFNVKYKGIFYAFNKLIKITNYLLKLNNKEDFVERKLNIQAYINSFAGSKYDNSVEDYILYRDMAVRQEKVLTDKSFVKAVEITTMHSSKGLEYPVVILPFLNQDYLKSPYNSEIKINKYFGIGVKDFNEDERVVKNGLFYNVCKLKNKQQEISEKIRLLYVAMTRAKNKLIMIGSAKNDYKKIDDNVFSINNFLSMLIGILPQDLIDNINNKQEISCKLLGNDRLQLIVTRVEELINDNLKEQVIIPKQTELNNIEELSKYLTKLIVQKASNIALKNSVSEFAFDEDSNITFAPKTFNVSEHLLYKASDVGTLYHKLLEIIDFSNIKNLEDLSSFAVCNFSIEEVAILNQIGYKNIFNIINKIKQITNGFDIILKEQKFVMKAKHNEVVDEGEDCYILIQGIVDLIAVGQNEVLLVDYKHTQKDDEQIKQTYQKQLYMYELALKKRFPDKIIKKVIINLRKNSLIFI